MDPNTAFKGRRLVAGMGWLWMVCLFHLAASLEGKNWFYSRKLHSEACLVCVVVVGGGVGGLEAVEEAVQVPAPSCSLSHEMGGGKSGVS